MQRDEERGRSSSRGLISEIQLLELDRVRCCDQLLKSSNSEWAAQWDRGLALPPDAGKGCRSYNSSAINHNWQPPSCRLQDKAQIKLSMHGVHRRRFSSG